MISFLKNNWFQISAFNIIVIYIVGICGICCTNPTDQKIFLQLTPLNLLVTTIYILLFHQNWNLKIVASLIFIFLFGFFIEVIGVKTQAIFGAYNYGKTLGFTILNVPLMMGFNWLLLIYCIATSLNKIPSVFLFSLCSAILMTSLDFLIEPIAMKLDFWQWNNGMIPAQNYVAWFLLSLFLFILFRIINGKVVNKFSQLILVIQFLFFGILNVFLK